MTQWHRRQLETRDAQNPTTFRRPGSRCASDFSWGDSRLSGQFLLKTSVNDALVEPPNAPGTVSVIVVVVAVPA